MLAALVVAFFAFILYLLLTFASGTVGAWSVEELVAGGAVGVLISAATLYLVRAV